MLLNNLDWFHIKNQNNKKKRVGYRRVSGKLGLTSIENGYRGAWVEKRIALFKSMLNYGYKIIPLSEATEQTSNSGLQTYTHYQDCDVLILEFGGTNLQFYKNYWDKTVEMINAHKGQIIFINDDPDLPFIWNLLPNEDWSRWTIAVNATNTDIASTILKCPTGTTTIDLPMASGMEFSDFHTGTIEKVVYIGRPNGRSKYFNEYVKSPELQIAGKLSEWSEYTSKTSVIENPKQCNRRSFYQQYKGCLSVYDNKHKISGWRTGRAYHALYAGIPVCCPKGNNGLSWCFSVNYAEDISIFAKLDDDLRKTIWTKQKTIVENTTTYDFIETTTA